MNSTPSVNNSHKSVLLGPYLMYKHTRNHALHINLALALNCLVIFYKQSISLFTWEKS